MKAHYIRLVLTAILLGFVWAESGWATSLVITFIAIRLELDNYNYRKRVR